MFLFVLAAVSVAGYVFVLRPSKAEAGEVQVPQTISINQRDLPAAQAAFADTFQVLGESLPLPGDHEALRRQLVIAGYRWPASVAIFLGIKAASAVLFAVAVIWIALVTDTEAFGMILGVACGLGFGYMIPDRVLDRLGAARIGKLRRALPAASIYWFWRSKLDKVWTPPSSTLAAACAPRILNSPPNSPSSISS